MPQSPSRRAVLLTAGAALFAGTAAAAAHNRIVLIEAPTNLGLSPLKPNHEPGAWSAPAAYRRAGLPAALRPKGTVSLPRPRYSFEVPKGDEVRNTPALRAYSEDLAGAVQRALAAGDFPVVVGGDCAILIGCMAGARRIGETGLVHIDAHADYRHPGNDPTLKDKPGGAAGMDLALVAGHGDPRLTRWDGREGSLVPDARIVQVGERFEFFPELKTSAMTRLNYDWVTANGGKATGTAAVAALEKAGARRFWLHLDVDVLDSRIMPAVDSPAPKGLNYDQVSDILGRLVADRRCIGFDVAIFDPELDPDGRYAHELTAMLAKGLAPRIV
jgi:arginase